MLDFGREVCGHLETAQKREWLVTNGLGGFAMGTVAGMRTRRYHGLLLAALKPPLGRTLLLAQLDETAGYLDRAYPLFANHWADGTVEPNGHHFLERFHLEGLVPVWTYAMADALLEKRIWMEQGANSTYVHYRLVRGSEPLHLVARALVSRRDYHHTTQVGSLEAQVYRRESGLRISFDHSEPALHLLSSTATWEPRNEWYEGFFLAEEAFRGQQDDTEDLVYAAKLRVTLMPGASCCLVASTKAQPDLSGEAALARRQDHENQLLAQAQDLDGPPAIRRLVLAADQFIVRRSAEQESQGRSVIAGYPWFSDWGRDTMIALPGLTLSTGRSDVAASILRTFARFIDQGMLPNRFPDEGEAPEYNTVDATLWYFEAIRAYLAKTGDVGLLRELYPRLEEIVDWHERGTRYRIRLDPDDGLLYAGEPGVQLTWMDAKVGDWVVTPRVGKPVEINALWFNALHCLAAFARRLGLESKRYESMAEASGRGFQRFWQEASGYCHDVLDGPEGEDLALRPNQLLAVSLPYSPLGQRQQKAVVDACSRHLLTSLGLRSLAPDHQDYIGRYGGDQRQRDAAYHQGTVWGWLIGPYVAAHLRVYQDPAAARAVLGPFFHHLNDHGLGSLSEVCEGDPPFTPRACPAQAWSVSEVLRVWQLTAD